MHPTRHLLAPLLLAVLAFGAPFRAAPPPGDPTPGDAGEPAGNKPQEGDSDAGAASKGEPGSRESEEDVLWSERIAVTAEVIGPGSEPLSVNATVLDPTKTPGTPSTVAAVVADVPGVSENGQGGHFQVFSIRGISRHRVLNFVSGMRIHSERRAGASVSFVDPLLLGSVTVLRGPSTSTHGSGALGGAVEVSPRSYGALSVQSGYDSRGDENYQVLGYGTGAWSMGFARRDAGDARSADGTRLNSHFTQYSATLSRTWQSGPRRYEILFLPALADDVGKANVDAPGRTTNYPLERHQLLRFGVESRGGWRSHGYLHAHDLETEVVDVIESPNTRNRVFNDSLDYGLGWDRDHDLSGGALLSWGVQAVGRRGVDAHEVRESLDPTGPPAREEFDSLDDAREIEAGVFANVRWDRGSTGFQVGGRASWIDQENSGGAGRDRTGLNGFVAVNRNVGERVELRASLGTGIRFPNLSEQFFTGTTGAGGIVGNPDLDPERSLSAEVSARWVGRKLLINGALFRNEIDDYIEREDVPGSEDLLTFENLTSGTLQGVDVQGLFLSGERWRVSFGGHLLRGRSDEGEPLSDVPSHEAFLGVAHHRGPWSFETRLTQRAAKTDASGTELNRPAAGILRATVGRRLTSTWWVTLTGSNLLDEEYYPSADRKAAPAPASSVGIQWVRLVP